MANVTDAVLEALKVGEQKQVCVYCHEVIADGSADRADPSVRSIPVGRNQVGEWERGHVTCYSAALKRQYASR